MQLTIVGGGGFRTPLVYGALLDPSSGVTEVVLHDVDEARLRAVSAVLAQIAASPAGGAATQAPTVRLTTDLDHALEGADFVFSAVRVGGLAARVADERVALDLGVLGQETTGPGGISFGLRTIPVARRIAERVRAVAPEAWVINFTNPAGMITEAMQSVLGDRVVGICDTPITMAKRAALVLGIPAGEPLDPDYVGLNHLGWLRGLRHHGVDVLPRLLADDGLLAATEEGQLFGLDWLRTLGALPNEYLYYTYFRREAVAAIADAGPTRGEFLLDQQDRFYAAVAADPSRAGELWRATRREREDTYMAAEHGGSPRGGEAGVADVGGYEGVALALMHAISRDERTSMILNVRNGSTVPGL
ncbi:MAG: 6-phospho-beta-glucosidase, partial [Actinomycetota bacterium]|nr:6-phospho-beta-glucosidase [Actinomycetota bacterium]